MPHPKNRLKLTGDTHLPDVGLDLNLQDDEALDKFDAEQARVYADGYVPGSAEEMTQPEPPGTLQKVERKVERQTARKPWVAVGAALLFGWVVARMLRD